MKSRLWCFVLGAFLAAFGLPTFSLSAATLHVSLGSPNPRPPFATGATAATNIQDAVDAAKAGDTVLVTNGVYRFGERDIDEVYSRVTITNSVALRSVNGPDVTVLKEARRTRVLATATLSGVPMWVTTHC